MIILGERNMSKKKKDTTKDIHHEHNRERFLDRPIVSAIIGGLVPVIFTSILGTISGFVTLPSKVGALEEQMKNIEDQNKDILSRLSSAESSIDLISEIIVENTTIYVSDLGDVSRTDYGLSVTDSNVFQTSAGEQTAKELQNQRIITSYMEDGQEVIFCGQYNEKYHWQGNCIINSFKDDKLTYAEAAIYDDGVRTFNEQLFDNDTSWVYVKRIQFQDTNIGDTWKYYKEKDIPKNIVYDNPNENDLIIPSVYVNTFSKCLSHYKGDTSDSKYNDTSGDAYLVTFDNNGYVKTLYQGCFVDGEFEDSTGKAWYITREPDKDTNYMYYKGTFIAGHPTGDGEKENPLTKNTFNELTKDITILEGLKWNKDYIE